MNIEKMASSKAQSIAAAKVMSGIAITVIGTFLLATLSCTSSEKTLVQTGNGGHVVNWVKVSLFMVAPEDMNEAKRLSFSNFSNGLIGYFFDTNFETGANGMVYQRESAFSALDTTRSQIASSGALGIWRLDSTVDLGKVSQEKAKKTLMLSMLLSDADLQKQGNARSWPSDQIMLSFLNWALREAQAVGIKQGSLRFTKMSYNQTKAEFNVNIEIR